MKRYLYVAVGMVMALSLASVLWAQVTQAPAPADQPAADRPVQRPLGATGQRGYLKVCPESKQLWEQLGRLQTQLHKQQWDLFVLLNAETRDREQLQNELEKLRNLTQEIKQTREQLQKYQVVAPRRAANRERPGAGGERAGAGGPPPTAQAPGPAANPEPQA